MSRRIKKSPSIIERAKETLREEFERNPKSPSRRAVRKAGLAYVFNTPGSRRSVRTDAMGRQLRKLRKEVTRTATVRDGGRWATIKMNKISFHERRPWVPAKLGRLAFRGEPSSKPIEILSLATSKMRHAAEVSEHAALPIAAEVATFLLSLPTPDDKKQEN